MPRFLKLANLLACIIGILILVALVPYVWNYLQSANDMSSFSIWRDGRYILLALFAAVSYALVAATGNRKRIALYNGVTVFLIIVMFWNDIQDMEGVMLFAPFILLGIINVMAAKRYLA